MYDPNPLSTKCDLTGLEASRRIKVDGDKIRWHGVGADGYVMYNRFASAHLFHSKQGKRVVHYVILQFDQPITMLGVLDEIKHRGLRQPDRAEAETIMSRLKTGDHYSWNPESSSHAQNMRPLTGICGAWIDGRRCTTSLGSKELGYVTQFSRGKMIDIEKLEYVFPAGNDFIAVIPYWREGIQY